jgi:transcriptional regulator with XRE-family HTH domain
MDEYTLRKNIGTNVLSNRTKNHLTQDELADRSHCSRSAINSIENHRSEPHIITLKNIAIVFSTTVDFLTEDHTLEITDPQQLSFNFN